MTADSTGRVGAVIPPELVPHCQPERFRVLVQPFAHVGRGIHIQFVQLFQQQQRLIPDEFCHVEGGFFLFRHVSFLPGMVCACRVYCLKNSGVRQWRG
jgi:hypothetical protein